MDERTSRVGAVLLGGLVAALLLIGAAAAAAERTPLAGDRGGPHPAPTPRAAVPQIQYVEQLTRHIQPVDPETYVLGAGDLLTIALWGTYDSITLQMVSAEGELTLPVVGMLHVGGLTLAQAEALLRAQVSRYYRGVESGLSLQSLRQDESGR